MRLDGEGGVRVLHRALDAGIRFFDTADVYGPDPADPGANERLVAEALRTWGGDRAEVVVATKGGLVRKGKEWTPDGRARHLKAACEASLRNLGVERIDLYQLHAPDPKVPFETSLRALAALKDEGKVARIGLSNVRRSELEAAARITEIASVQVALSPLDLTPLKNGVAEYCAENGIALLAHSPLGGPRGRGKLERFAALRRIAERRGASIQEVALRWLLALHPGVIPLPGASRLESVDSIVKAPMVPLSAEDLEELESDLPASRVLRVPKRDLAPSTSSGDGEVVLFVGYPGAGKSTLAAGFAGRGYEVLSRDVEGGGLSRIRRLLEEKLSSGARRLVLDNTYPERASRFDVLEIAWRYGLPVACLWLRTPLEQAQVNAVERMVRRYGRLLSPEEMASAVRRDPNSFAPDAQFRYRDRLEPPALEEGFSRVETLEFEKTKPADRTGRGLLFEYDGLIRAKRPAHPGEVEIFPERAERLRRHAEAGYRLLGISYQPGVAEDIARACFARTNELLELEIEVEFCPHGAGPPICWCRKPMPGLGVVVIERHGLDPEQSLLIEASAADRAFASRLGMPTVSAEEFFRSKS
jgi:aryl-alcohol dehydrogenase-like predicted oxidoreductase/histidinol phosphatase-like enzyme/predicted kinase